ncbi:protein IWS1 homolog 1-like [Impatiens glandulifera]|uniref:protein IWS1 homolog 1-like n=1 Tax=Impatiens glandulifera TaxID=253017 RepID=UPI001FB08C35|nr:protein IWS1 homolog 1-like [Impatiens glandulifera]
MAYNDPYLDQNRVPLMDVNDTGVKSDNENTFGYFNCGEDDGIDEDGVSKSRTLRRESDNDGAYKRESMAKNYGGEGSRKSDKRDRHGSNKVREHDRDQANATTDSEEKVEVEKKVIVSGFFFLLAHDVVKDGEEEDEDLFKMRKKKKKHHRSAAEISMLIENVMAELEIVAEEDVELNKQSKPAISKLKKLSLLQEVFSKKQLQAELLDHGVLTLLKTWLEPLPDGSLPNINIREAILQILQDFPIDLEQSGIRDQLKKSGLGKVIMFLSKSDEEIMSNKRLAKELVDKWCRSIFNNNARFEDMKKYGDERIPSRKSSKKTRMKYRDDDINFAELPKGQNSRHSSSRNHVSRPEAMPMDFIVRPPSKVDPDAIRACSKQVVQDQIRLKIQKKLKQLKAPKKKQLQAKKLSVEGRGMVL